MRMTAIAPELRWLLRQVWPLRRIHAWRLVLMMLASVLGLVDPLIVKWILDEAVPRGRADLVVLAALVFFAVYAGRTAATAAASYLHADAGQRLVRRVRMRLLGKLQRLGADFHTTHPVGDTLSRVERDAEGIENIAGTLSAAIVAVVTGTVFSIAVMLSLHWKLTLLVIPLVPLFYVLRRVWYPRLKSMADVVQSAAGTRSAFLQSHLSAITQVQLLCAERLERRNFARVLRESSEVALRRRRSELALFVASSAVTVAGLALILGYGGYEAARGAMTAGALVAFYTYVFRIFSPVQELVDIYSQVQRVYASVRRIEEIERSPAAMVQPRIARPLDTAKPEVVALENVTFAYPKREPVLANLSLTVREGERVAVVGPSGAGKSTLAALLCRLWDPREGRVLLRGVDVRELGLHRLRSAVCLVPQDAVIFDGTLYENLVCGLRDVSDEDLANVLIAVALDEVVARLPHGLDERVGPRGATLSGGERQRVALARALLRTPELLILDEATAALDGATERRVLAAIAARMPRTAVITIAHRLSATAGADRVVVLSGGAIAAEGAHQAVYSAGGVYRELVDAQAISA